MSSSYHSQYPLLHIDLNQDHDPFTYSSLSSSSSSTALLYPIFINPNRDGAGYSCIHQVSNPIPENHHEANAKAVLIAGSCELHNPTVPKLGRIKLSIIKKKNGSNNIGNGATGEGTNGDSGKLTSSKIRLTTKMAGSSDQAVADHRMPESSMKDHEQASSFRPDNNNNMINTVAVRVCSDCNTTKTPLWRSGPRGPKSLCNACGIRQRKARRVMAGAVVAANGTVFEAGSTPPPPSKTNKVQKKERKKKASDSHLPFKKRCNNLKSRAGRGRKRIGFEDLPMILSENSTFHQVFPQDERDAAILLMALSYGLVHG